MTSGALCNLNVITSKAKLFFLFLPDRNDAVLVVFQRPFKGLTQGSTSESHSTGHSANFCWRGRCIGSLMFLGMAMMSGSWSCHAWPVRLHIDPLGCQHFQYDQHTLLSQNPYNVKYGVTERLLLLLHQTFVGA